MYRPERHRDLHDLLSEKQENTCIARGLGRSYGDTAVNGDGNIAMMERLNRMLDFDAETGILYCEGGVTLAEIIDLFLPRGYFLPVTPGTKFVTVGGAIANDVHGKNHHGEGSFSQFVSELELLTATGDVLTCSPTQNEDIFWATVGGIGLTGFITTARIQLQRVESAYITVDYHKCRHLDEALTVMAEQDKDYQYSVAWVDCLAKGKHLGRSVIMHGNHARVRELSLFHQEHPFKIHKKCPKNVPIDLPGFLLNPLSVRAFNTLFYAAHYTRPAAVTDYDSYFYPLDAIHNWNRGYGKKGFVQYQATLPPQSKQGLVQLLERLSASRRASFLAVLKCFGEGGQGLLSHPMKGYTLTLDIPNHGGLFPFLEELDNILLDHGGRLYLAKDTATTPENLAKMYPRLDEFRAIKERLDPHNRLSSTMARRLGIVAQKETEHV